MGATRSPHVSAECWSTAGRASQGAAAPPAAPPSSAAAGRPARRPRGRPPASRLLRKHGPPGPGGGGAFVRPGPALEVVLQGPGDPQQGLRGRAVALHVGVAAFDLVEHPGRWGKRLVAALAVSRAPREQGCRREGCRRTSRTPCRETTPGRPRGRTRGEARRDRRHRGAPSYSSSASAAGAASSSGCRRPADGTAFVSLAFPPGTRSGGG